MRTRMVRLSFRGTQYMQPCSGLFPPLFSRTATSPADSRGARRCSLRVHSCFYVSCSADRGGVAWTGAAGCRSASAAGRDARKEEQGGLWSEPSLQRGANCSAATKRSRTQSSEKSPRMYEVMHHWCSTWYCGHARRTRLSMVNSSIASSIAGWALSESPRLRLYLRLTRSALRFRPARHSSLSALTPHLT